MIAKYLPIVQEILKQVQDSGKPQHPGYVSPSSPAPGKFDTGIALSLFQNQQSCIHLNRS